MIIRPPMLMVRAHPRDEWPAEGRPNRDRCLREGAVATGGPPHLTQGGVGTRGPRRTRYERTEGSTPAPAAPGGPTRQPGPASAPAPTSPHGLGGAGERTHA